MSAHPAPEFRTQAEPIILTGTMRIYASQDEASRGIPHQWQAFLKSRPGMSQDAELYGASPCTGDGKIHYLAGVLSTSPQTPPNQEHLLLAAGDYAVVKVDAPSTLRDTWVWLLTHWLQSSGRKEKHAPEFERYTAISSDGTPSGPVEIWIPLESVES